MATYTIYDYKVYTRAFTGDAWTHRPEMLCASCETHAGKTIGRALLSRYYGPDDGTQHQPLELIDHWVRITLCLPGGEEDIFYGVIVEQRLEEDARLQRWAAHDLKELLERVRIVTLFGEHLHTLRAVPVRPCVFNGNIDTPARAVGLRSNWRYHYAYPRRGDQYSVPDTCDSAYALGGAQPWNAFEILEHLLRVYCPRPSTESVGFCPIGFNIEGSAVTAVAERLEQNRGEYNLFGRSLLDAIETLVRESGDLSWRIDWTDDGVHGYTFPKIEIFRCDWDAATMTGSSVSPSDVLPAIIEDDGYNRVTDVWAFGGACKIMFTSRADTTPGFGKGWTSALETEWLSVNPDLIRYSLERYDRVYRTFVFAYGEDWDSIMFGPDLGSYDVEPGDLVATANDWRMDWYTHARPLLRRNIIRAATTYASQDDALGTALTQTAWAGQEDEARELEPLYGWLVPDGADETVRYLRLAPLEEESGFRILDHPADLALHQGTRWQRLVVTGTVEADWLLLAKSSLSVPESELVNVRFVFEPAYQWWAARPDTIVHIDCDAAWNDVTAGPPTRCRTVYGVVRNDYPKLKQLADNMLVKFNAVRKAVRFTYKSTAPGRQLGEFVTDYNGHMIYAPVMSIRHRLTDDIDYGTTIQTLHPMR